MHALDYRHAALGLLALASAWPLAAQTLRVLQAAPLRSERSADAAALSSLATGQAVTLLQMNGGWVRVQAGSTQGWLRASQLEMPGAEIAAVSQRETGRRQDGATAVTLGVRSVPAQRNGHALIVGIGAYQADASRRLPSLAGVPHDIVSALAMTRAWSVPPEQVTLLRDADATREGVRQALRELDGRVQSGDRVFVYWAGMGSRQLDARSGGCVQTLVPHDLRDIGPGDWAQWMRPMAAKAASILFVQDGGGSPAAGPVSGASAAGPAARTGPAEQPMAPAGLASRFAAGAEACRDPGKLGPHNLVTALREAAVAAPDIVHITSSRPAEASFEDPASGGLATLALGRCLQGEVGDPAQGPAGSVAAWLGCAQPHLYTISRRLAPPLAQHLVANGNLEFVPAR